VSTELNGGGGTGTGTRRTDQAPSTLLYPVGKNVFINTADDCQKAKGTKLLLLLLCVLQQYFMFSKFFTLYFFLSRRFARVLRRLTQYNIRFVQKMTNTLHTSAH